MTTLQKTLVTATVAILTGAAIYQSRQNSKLHGENQSLTEQITQAETDSENYSNRLAQSIATIPPPVKRLPDAQFNELLRLRGEVGSLRLQTNDLRKLQAENQRLQSSLETVGTNAASVTIAPKESWAFVGYTDPESAFQSAFWSMNQGDAKTLLSSLAPGGRESQKVQSWSEEQYLKKRQEQFDKVTAFKIIDKEVISSDEAILTVFLDGIKEGDRYRLQRVANDWKLDGPYRPKPASPAAQ